LKKHAAGEGTRTGGRRIEVPMKRHARAPLPLVTLALAVAIVAVFAVELVDDGMGLCQRYGLVPAHPSFEAAITSLFVHDPSGALHVGGNLAFLIVFGVIVERSIGGLGLFTVAGSAGAALHVLVDPGSTSPLVGCSGALFGVLAVAGVLRPRLLGFVVAFAAINVLHAFTGSDGAVSFGAHLGGFFAGFLVIALARLRGFDPHGAAA
jgi:membrane associated rhomboid family serine protease